ncbi:bromodomain associated protein [Ceratobasidium sp. AG-Ba]|nr:bromodomain associated protein [Ceratobasidium sp. AG-Ba]
MASRATRGMASLQDAIEKLSIREKLLLSQAIYDCGSAKWDEVSKIDLVNAIAAEEARFKTLTTEIEEINAGKWDDKILAELNPSNSNEGFARPSASPLPRHLTLETSELSQRQSSPSDSGRPHSPAGRSTRDGTPAEAGSKPVSTASSGSRPWNQKDNKRVREMKERKYRERMASMVSDTPEQPDETLADSAPPTPVTGPSRNELIEAPVPPATTESPKVEETAPSTADDVQDDDEVVQSSQPKEESKAAKTKRRASDVSMADGSREPKRPRQEDVEMADVSTAPAESPEPSTSTQSLPTTARPSAALTSTPTPTTAAPPQTNKKFQTVIGMVHSQISQLRGGNIFHNPIKKSEAPDYYEIVRRPMDLKTVKGRIKDGLVSSTDHFKRDVYLMFANAIMYNRPGTSVNDIAAEMMLESEKHIADFRAAEEFNKPGRG